MYAWRFVRQQTDVQTLRNSFCVLPLWPWFSPSLTSLTFYVSYFRFVDDVMSADNRPRKGDTVNQSINHSITQACTFTVVQLIKSLQDPLEVVNWGSMIMSGNEAWKTNGQSTESDASEGSSLPRQRPMFFCLLLMPSSHRPPDTTTQCCLCRVRRCELSLETVWQSLNSQPIDHPRRAAFSREDYVQSYAAVHSVFTFLWRTTSLRVGGRAAAVDRQARQSCLVWCGGVN